MTEKRSSDIDVSSKMKAVIKEVSGLVKDGASKAEAARESYALLNEHSRKQVMYVFINGVGLTQAGAATYYQKIKKASACQK